MNIDRISVEARAFAEEEMLEYLKVFKEPETYYTFSDKAILPSALYGDISRTSINVKESFATVMGTNSNLLPIFGASMSYMRSAFGNDISEAGATHVLPRVELSELQRLEDIGNSKYNVGVSIGTKDTKDFIKCVLESNKVDFLSVDIAHGASAHVIPIFKTLRELGICTGVIVGNVGSLFGYLYLLGLADQFGIQPIIKAGIGPGSVCMTRVNTGVGVGQLTLLEQLWNYYTLRMHEVSPPKFISDGGIECPGDFVKALTRSHGVMIGKYFASPSFESHYNGTVMLYGMASSEVEGKTAYIEGGKQTVPINFYLSSQGVVKLREGLQSAMTYVGANNLNDFRSTVKMVLNSRGAMLEGGLH